jgi:uncharacterized protein YukE
MASKVEHAADQAGGEVVYASDGPADGVAPTALPMRFPIRHQSGASMSGASMSGASMSMSMSVGDTDTDTVLDDGSQTTAVQAFEVFSGKLYHPGMVQGTSTRASSARLRNQNETPLERLGRLQRELAELEEQTGGAGDNDSGIDQEDWNRTVSDLQTRLQSTQQKYSWSAQQEQLNTALERAVQQGEGGEGGEGTPPATTAAHTTPVRPVSSLQRASSSLQKAAQDGAKTGAPTTPATAAATAAAAAPKTASSSASLDERMRRLELAVGSNSASHESSASSSSWSERLRLMEQAVGKLDSKQLDTAVSRSKVIRQDLEAASKARNKLLTNSRSQGADAATIQTLHTAYTDLQGMAQYLSPLAVRLSVLARQHQDQATQGVRLLAAEETVATMQQQLTSVETAVQQLQEGWKVNAAAMETNIKALDARMVEVVKK